MTDAADPLKPKYRRVLLKMSGEAFGHGGQSGINIDETLGIARQIKRLVGRGGNRSAVLQGFVDGLDSTDSTILAELLDEAQRRRREDPEPDGRT